MLSRCVWGVFLAASLLPLASIGADEKKEWGKGVPYTTDFELAIRMARESGKMLFIYNGWEREGI